MVFRLTLRYFGFQEHTTGLLVRVLQQDFDSAVGLSSPFIFADDPPNANLTFGALSLPIPAPKLSLTPFWLIRKRVLLPKAGHDGDQQRDCVCGVWNPRVLSQGRLTIGLIHQRQPNMTMEEGQTFLLQNTPASKEISFS